MAEEVKYEESGIDTRIIRAVKEIGFDSMTPIQSQAIPVLMEGKDIIGQAQTGTGKTAAFGIPIIQKINPENRRVQAIVLCPTRELAIQAANEMRKFAKYMQSVKIVPVYGGQDINGQIKLIRSGAQIVVGTPGRVMDHMRRHTLKLDNINIVVLDEADEMLNMGFRDDMESILKEIPGEHQTALFSATMPREILNITKNYQKEDAIHIRIAAKELTVPLVKQYYYQVKAKYKGEAVRRLLQAKKIKRSIVFCNTKKMVDELTGMLKNYGYQAEGLHGDLSQKQRDFVMKHFRLGHTEVLVATDVAARGIDVDDLEAVINYDIPQDIEFYVHRIGRTGRAGREGTSHTLISGKEIYRVKDIEKLCRTKMEYAKLPSSTEIIALKAEKLFDTAKNIIDKGDLLRMTNILQYEINKGEYKLEELAAAMLKMHIGEETTDIDIEEKIYTYRNEYSRQRNDRNYVRSGKNYGRSDRDNVRGSKKYKEYGKINNNDMRKEERKAYSENRQKSESRRKFKDNYKSTRKFGKK